MKKEKLLLLMLVIFGFISLQISAQDSCNKEISYKAFARVLTPHSKQKTNTDNTTTKNWNDIPKYSVVKYIETDSITGTPLKNEDGTVRYRMLLVDQFGNKRSAKSVAAQQAKVKAAIETILAKVSAGTAIGVATGLAGEYGNKGNIVTALSGGIIGAGTGVVASFNDIKEARKWKKVLKQQEKLLKAYQKNYNEEGVPKNASVEPSKIKNLDFNEENIVSSTTDDIKKEIESATFTTSNESAFDF